MAGPEASRLLEQQPRPARWWHTLCSRYRSSHFCVRSKAAILILFWSFLVMVAVTGSVPFDSPYLFHSASPVVMFSVWSGIDAMLYLFYPLAGFMADVCCGRHKTVNVALWIFLVGISAYSVLKVIESYSVGISSLVAFYIMPVPVLLLSIGVCGFQANAIQYGLDQLLDAPSEQSSIFIYWCFLVSYIGHILGNILKAFISGGSIYLTIIYFVALTCTAATFFVTLCLSWFRRGCFFLDSANTNPYKLVYRVLRFAAKNKYPIQRSAFTYCEDELPSRIDFGKSKYGGPFTTEEVEDVKTFLGILKLLLSLGPAFSLEVAVYYLLTILTSHFEGSASFQHVSFKSLLVSSGSLPSAIIVIIIPLYITVLRPLIYHRIPGTLKRMGLGILCFLLTIVYYFSVDTVGHMLYRNENSTCLLLLPSNTSIAIPLHISAYSLLVPNIVIALGYMLTYIASYEFICAQSPHMMKGLLIGVFFAIRGLFQLLGAALIEPFFFWKPHFPSCGFGYYLVNIFIAIVGLVVYTVVARRYKYRQRDEPCNVRRFVEEYYDRSTNYERLP